MLVTSNTLIGYTIINGTVGIQLAMFVASLFNLFVFDDISSSKLFTEKQLDSIEWTRRKCVISHCLLMLVNICTGNPRFQHEGIK